MNRSAQRMKRFAEKNRQAKEIADAYIDKYGTDNRVKLGKVVNEQIRLAVFDLIGEIEEIREDPEIKSPQIAVCSTNFRGASRNWKPRKK
jgi:hypothetical protein